MERGRNTCPWRRSGRHAYRAAGRSRGQAKPLYRSSRQWRADSFALRAERKSAAGSKIHLQARLDGASHRAMQRNSMRPASRSCWLATTTSCRPIATSIRPGPTPGNALGSAQSRAGVADPVWRKAGSTPSERSIPTRRCTHSGTTRGTGGRATRGCASTICCSERVRRSVWSAAGVDREVRRGGGRERSCTGMDRVARSCARSAASRVQDRQAPRGRRHAFRKRGQKAVRCSSSTAIASRTAPITRCRRRSGGAAARRRRHRRLRQPAAAPLWRGEAARRARGMGHARGADLPARGSPPTRADASSTTSWSSSLTCCRNSSPPAAFANAKAAGYEADDFLAARPCRRKNAEAARRSIASGDRDAFQLASERTTILFPVRAGEMARIGPARFASATASSRRRFPISSRCGVIRPTRCPARRASGQGAAT